MNIRKILPATSALTGVGGVLVHGRHAATA